MPVDYIIHWLLELIGGGACMCATRFCRHRILRGFVWLAFSAASTIVTVNLVG